MRRKYTGILLKALLTLMPVAAVVTALLFGRFSLGVGKVFSALLHPSGASATVRAVVWQLRLPRAVAGAFVGASLAVSGTAYQGVFRNPLVNSGLLGVSNGAAFGAAAAIVFFGGGYMTYLFSFGFAILAVILSTLCSLLGGGSRSVTLILGGVIVSTVFGSLTSIMKYLADPITQLPAITFWTMGSFGFVNYTHFVAFIPMLVGMGIIFICRFRINVLSMGNKEALALGINVSRYKAAIICAATLCTASSVCISGAIGWVGLLIPHICRMLIGNDNTRLVPLSASLGATFMVITDIFARCLTTSEIPIGILTSLIGAPFFIYLIKRTKGGAWA